MHQIVHWFTPLAMVGVMALAGETLAQTPTQQREAAVLRARGGHMAEAQQALRALLARGVDDGLVAMDLVTLLQQDGKPWEAISVFEQAASPGPPDYALLAATRAYRDLARFPEAEALARQGARRFPTDDVWPLLLSLILSDAGKTDEALTVLRQMPGSSGTGRLLAEAYAWRRAGDPFRALQLYTAAINQAPANTNLRSEVAGLLLEMNGPYGAAAFAGTPPRIAAGQAAAMVRWGMQIRPADPARRYETTDAALIRLDGLLAALPAPPAEAAMRRRLRLDRLVALRDRVRMQEAAAEAEALLVDGPLPPYAEHAYGDALLYLRRPDAARRAYDRILAQTPLDLPARYGRFYASVELEDFATAYAAIDSIIADEPLWRGYRNDPSRYDNPERAFAEVTAALARYYGNQLGDAWARITRISDAAPANAYARLARYQVASARRWPRLATEEGEIAASLAPDQLDSQIALIEIAIANERYAEAQRLMDALLARYPESLAVQHLARDLKASRRWLLEVESRPSTSDGGGANATGRAFEATGRLTSPPIDDNWRIFAVTNYANAHPPEGFVDRSQAGAGVEWRSPSLTETIYAASSWGTLARGAGGATLDWNATDQLRLAAAAELFSWDTPIRALYYGIRADEYSLKATYRWHESRSVAATVAYLPFTDGNRRLAGGLAYRERLVNQPGFDLTGRADAYASSNSRGDAAYYNPRRDLSLTAGATAEHQVWRHYDRSFVQALTIDAGLYAERGYTNDWIATLNYEHRWRFDPLTAVTYGAGLARRVYDGSVENSLFFVIRLTQRI